MKYNKGDKVVVRKDLALFDDFDRCTILQSMKDSAGLAFIIRGPNGSYRNRWLLEGRTESWTEEMFEDSSTFYEIY